MNKILLINPPGKCHLKQDGTVGERKHMSPPLGLAYLAANLLAHSYEVDVIDALAEGYEQERKVGDFIIYGLGLSSIVKKVKAASPDLVGISVMFSNKVYESLEIASAIKNTLPDVKIVFGGQHPSAMPMEIMKNKQVDFVLVGDADKTIVMLADSLRMKKNLKNVPCLYYRKNGKIIDSSAPCNPAVQGNGWRYMKPKDSPAPDNLSKIPFPAWKLFPMEKYWSSSVRIGGGDIVAERFALMISSRGCPNACNFCASSLMGGYRSYRVRPAEDILKEIRWLIDEFQVQEVQFMEDNFFASKKRVKRLLSALAESFPNIIFSVPAGTEINKLDVEIIELMARANFHKVTMAVESGDPEVQKSHINKSVKLSRLPQILRSIRENGMESRGLFMIGFPGETRTQIEHTLDLALNSSFDDFFISLVTPLPGTELYDDCLHKGLLRDGFDAGSLRYSTANIKLPDLSFDELERMRREVWLKYHAKNAFRHNEKAQDGFLNFNSTSEYETIGFNSL